MEESQDISNHTTHYDEHEFLRLENFFIKLYLDVRSKFMKTLR